MADTSPELETPGTTFRTAEQALLLEERVGVPPGPAHATTTLIARAAAWSIFVALTIGIPTDVIPNPWFSRMTPVRTLDIILLPLTAGLTGLLLATYHRAPGRPSRRPSAGVVTGTLGWLAIGCPLCNKLVVLAIGTSGALSYFAPLQPVLGVPSVVLAMTALALRLRALRFPCPVPQIGDQPA